MPRPTIRDLAAKAGLSPSTVDRVLNGRGAVRPETAHQVLKAAEAVGFHGINLIQQRLKIGVPQRAFGFLLQHHSAPFHRALGEALVAATESSATFAGRAKLIYSEDLDPVTVASRLEDLGNTCDAIGVATADHPLIGQAIDRLRNKGVPVFAVISDLSAKALAGYVGLDNRKVGRTAAWFIAQTAKAGGRVAISVGTHRHMCQETCEMSFRSYIREHAPRFELLEPLVTYENEENAYEGTANLLKRCSDLKGLYVAGGGIRGVLRALREDPTPRDLKTISLEWNDETHSALLEGHITVILAHPVQLLAKHLVEVMDESVRDTSAAGRVNVVVPFEVYIPENA